MVIDIFILAYLRQDFTRKTIEYIKKRTYAPYRLVLIDNGGNEEFKDSVDHYIKMDKNVGVHGGWNMALENAQSEYFVTTDNDILVPELDPDWLEQLVNIMNLNPEYAAISLHPHVFIGAANMPVNEPADLVERNMCGAVMRLMKTNVVKKVGGWEKTTEPGRNHEESHICNNLKAAGWKVGITPKIRAYHMFGSEMEGTWGYPKEFTPEMQKHNPELWGYVKNFDNIKAYDNKTWLPK